MVDKSEISALVVDDDAVMIDVTKLALEAAGITDIHTAEDGLAAKALVEKAEKPFSIVICDWMMPKLDGPGFLKYFRQANKNTPFIMLTGQSSESEYSSLDHVAADYFMSKQSSFNDIRTKIVKLLEF